MKKLLVFLLTAVMAMGLMSTITGAALKEASDEPVIELEPGEGLLDIEEYLWEIPEDASLEEKVLLETRNYTIIRSMEPLFNSQTYKGYSKAHSALRKEQSEENVDAAIAARRVLLQEDAVADRVIYLWGVGNSGPIADGETEPTEEQMDTESRLDSYGFAPFLIKYLVEDPTQAKGNVVVVAGGGFSDRSNLLEGYGVAVRFVDLGYNAYVLQRRIYPYSPEDIYMDMQRAIRQVKKAVAENGYGGADMIAATGFSGGGATVEGAINNCYGDLTPADVYTASYVPDDIDAINSDLNAALINYGAMGPVNPDNPNLPVFFITQGLADEHQDLVTGAQDLYDSVKERVPAEIRLYEGAKHGYAYGSLDLTTAAPGTETWMAEADVFMQEHLGFSEQQNTASTDAEPAESATEAAAEGADLPEGYTKVKTFEGTYGFGDAEMTVATNDAEDIFYITFECFDEEQALEGTVDDGIVSVDYDLTGFVSGDAQLIWDDAVASDAEWVGIQ